MAARVGFGVAAIDLASGQNPLDDRAFAQKVFDYGLNAYFLFHGQDPKAVLEGLRATADAEGKTVDQVFREIKVTRDPATGEVVFSKLTPRQGQEAALRHHDRPAGSLLALMYQRP